MKTEASYKTIQYNNTDITICKQRDCVIHGETVETVTDFTFLSPQITADDDCSHEIKRRLLFGRKVMINLDI